MYSGRRSSLKERVLDTRRPCGLGNCKNATPALKAGSEGAHIGKLGHSRSENAWRKRN